MADKAILFREECIVAGYVCVHVDKKKDNTIVLTQSGPTERIIDTLHLTDDTVYSADTQCIKYLGLDKDDKLAHHNFEYWSIVGQLNFLEDYSQPDITMAVSQCACFVHSPKHAHELALLRTKKYLKRTSDREVNFLSHANSVSV